MLAPAAMKPVRLCLSRALAAAAAVFVLTVQASAAPITPEEARVRAEEALILVYPMLQVYREILAAAVDEKSPEGQTHFNRFFHQTQLVYPAAQAERPNNDVLVTRAALDLRREPLVLQVPALPRERYFSFHLLDLNARGFGRVDSAGESQLARNYLIAAPGWKGRTPKNIHEVFRATANFALITGRTAVDGPQDLPAASSVLGQYTLTPLSEFLGAKAPRAAAKVKFPPYDAAEAGSAGFIAYANFLLGQDALSPQEKALLGKFRPIGLNPGRRFDAAKLPPEIRKAVDDGAAAALARIEAETPRLSARRNGWSLTGSALVKPEGEPEKPLLRAAAAKLGLWDGSLAVIYAPQALADDKDDPLNAFRHNYTLKFTKEQLPPAEGFWSIMMYGLPGERLVANAPGRHSLGSRSPDLKYDQDGSLTLYIQYKSPGGDRESNWLPAPNGPFSLALRIYAPKPGALNPLYAPPPVRRP